ncbi:MAG: hypothetical protein FWE04_00865 [Oscillospiraceae bacterium]|nr:hypothetical protein [Oscillospiraceae bacterium]
MEQKMIKHCGKLHEVSPEVHKAYETATRAIIRNNKDFHENEVATANVVKIDYVSFEDDVEDSLIVEQIKQLAAEHLTADEYIIYEKIFLDGLSERETAEIIGANNIYVHRKKQKIIEKIRNLLN